MRTREDIEQLEMSVLAPYAMKSSESAGREHDNSPHPFRACYQRDRDRIVHCEAFRKLEYKTQVFVILEGDYYRNRLTHTIEVAQIARTIGRCLQLNEDLIEVIALAHDLGHPPFAHAGESALNEIMKKENMGKFNHNFRSFELITKLEKRYPDFDGLDLTEEVRVGILKHQTQYDEKEEITKYKNIGTSLEAQVVDIADALTYISHDIDDGLTSGCITAEDLMESSFWQKVYTKISSVLSEHNEDMIKYQIVKFLIDIQITDLLSHTQKNLENINFKSSSQVKLYNLENPGKALVDFSPHMKEERSELQRLLHIKLYEHYRVTRMTEKARRIISEIFEVYKQNPRQLPPSVFNRDEKDQKVQKNIICNYIAGMTMAS